MLDYFKGKLIRRPLKRIFDFGLWQTYKDLDMLKRGIVFERIYRNFSTPLPHIERNQFVLFNYATHSLFGYYNLGDCIQAIATQRALEKISPNSHYTFFDRDKLGFYNPTTMGGGRIQ